MSALKKWLDDYPADFDVYMLEQLNEWLDQKVSFTPRFFWAFMLLL